MKKLIIGLVICILFLNSCEFPRYDRDIKYVATFTGTEFTMYYNTPDITYTHITVTGTKTIVFTTSRSFMYFAHLGGVFNLPDSGIITLAIYIDDILQATISTDLPGKFITITAAIY